MKTRTCVQRLVVLVVLITGIHCFGQDVGSGVFSRIVDNWRWSHYWFGETGIDEVYVAGESMSVLVFWGTRTSLPLRGMCSSHLGLCIAYAGDKLAPLERKMRMAPQDSSRQAFAKWALRGFEDASWLNRIHGLEVSDFHLQEMIVTLPNLASPRAVLAKSLPDGAGDEAKRIGAKQSCGSPDAGKREKCSGRLVFSAHDSQDPYWFVLRSCSSACEFGGDAILMLTRGDRHWEATSSGFIAGPKMEVERLKNRVERAEVLQIGIR